MTRSVILTFAGIPDSRRQELAGEDEGGRGWGGEEGSWEGVNVVRGGRREGMKGNELEWWGVKDQ